MDIKFLNDGDWAQSPIPNIILYKNNTKNKLI